MNIHENMETLLDAVRNEIYVGIDAHQAGPREVIFLYCAEDKIISQFSISILPGCRNVLIFHGVTVDPTARNQGWGKKLHVYRLAVAERYGANTVVCTVLQGNSVEKKILEGFGWTRTVSVTPGIELWSKQLR